MSRIASNVCLLAAVAFLILGIVAAALEYSGRLPPHPEPPYFVALLGLTFLSVGLSFATSLLPFYLRGRKTVGRVVEMRIGSDGNGRFPVVRFDVEGREYLFKSCAISSSRIELGDDVRICYLPENPTMGWIDHWTHLYLLPMIFGSVGVLILAIWVQSAIG